MIHAYIRVSTDKQTVDNQRFEIKRFCGSQGIAVGQWLEETVPPLVWPLFMDG